MGVGRSKPLDTDPRCRTLAPVWSPFVDAFVDTLHAQGAAVHPPPPRRTGIFSARTPRASGGAADDEDAAETATRDAKRHKFRSPGRPGPVFRPAAERLVAIGDLHGDLAKAREAFRAGGLTDADGRWIGGRTVAVQVGDQLDRGGDEVAIMYMLERLRAARDAGGELIVMNGNHETLNAAGRFRYAKPAGAEDFRRWRGRQLFGAALKAKCGERPGQCTLLGAESAAAAVEPRASRVPRRLTTARRLRHRRRRIGRARTPTVAPTGIIPRTNPRGVVGGIVDAASGGTRARRSDGDAILGASAGGGRRGIDGVRARGRARAPRGVRTRPREPRDERLDLGQKGGRAARARHRRRQRGVGATLQSSRGVPMRLRRA